MFSWFFSLWNSISYLQSNEKCFLWKIPYLFVFLLHKRHVHVHTTIHSHEYIPNMFVLRFPSELVFLFVSKTSFDIRSIIQCHTNFFSRTGTNYITIAPPVFLNAPLIYWRCACLQLYKVPSILITRTGYNQALISSYMMQMQWSCRRSDAGGVAVARTYAGPRCTSYPLQFMELVPSSYLEPFPFLLAFFK